MILKRLLSKQNVNNLSRLSYCRKISLQFSALCNSSTRPGQISSLSPSPHNSNNLPILQSPTSFFLPTQLFHSSLRSSSAAVAITSTLPSSDEADDTMSDFLSRFVYIMRGKLVEAFPDCEKDTINGMLLVIVEKVVGELEKGSIGDLVGEGGVSASASSPSSTAVLSEDLWRTVWEVSSTVCEDMEKERKKEKMKKFLQCEEVKTMAKFASEVGIRGDMLREFKFKWAREKMEESECYEELEKMRKEEEKEDLEDKGEGETFIKGEEAVAGEYAKNGENSGGQGGKKFVDLPKRKGKIKYKIYGLDLSSPKWKEVADKIHEAGERIWPQEAKPITGKCRLVTERILSLTEEDNPSSLLTEWVDMLQPNRVDWMQLLDKLKERNWGLYSKVAEQALTEPSFQTEIGDFFKIFDHFAKANQLEDAERILKKMDEYGIQPDILILSAIVQMYCKAGKVDRAMEAFEKLIGQGFKPDIKVYSSMIMGYVKTGQPYKAESLMAQMDAKGIKAPKEIFMALLQAFAEIGDFSKARWITTTMQFAGYEPSLESYTLLIEAYGSAGKAEDARSTFDYVTKLGLKLDDKCVASMLAAYERKNSLDLALDILLQLEKDGFEPGVNTYTVLVDWFGKLQLVDEAEQVLDNIARLGESPPFKIHVGLCDMYSRARVEKKALQHLGILEAKKEQLSKKEFDRVIDGLTAGGFEKDAQRMLGVMKSLGLEESEQPKPDLKVTSFLGKTKADGMSWVFNRGSSR